MVVMVLTGLIAQILVLSLIHILRYQLEWYPEHCTEQTCFYPGMWETLQWMAAKGIRLVIVTNKVETTAKKLANHFCSDLPFEEVWGNDQNRPLTPDPIAGKLLCETCLLYTSICIMRKVVLILRDSRQYLPR